MILYVRKLEDHHGLYDITLVCLEMPDNVEDYQIVEVENLINIV